jgi:putative hydrolase of the HAD superfamily
MVVGGTPRFMVVNSSRGLTPSRRGISREAAEIAKDVMSFAFLAALRESSVFASLAARRLVHPGGNDNDTRVMPTLPGAMLLDLDDTILDDSGCVERSWTDACHECCASMGEETARRVRGAIRAAAEWFWSDPERHRTGRLDMKAARRDVAALGLARAGVTNPDLADEIAFAYGQLREDRLALLPDALETVQWFRQAGCALALVTNGSRRMQRLKIERFGLAPLFDVILVEGELGYGKPDRRVYELALSRLKRSPGDAWMVGDNLEWDVAAPQALGIQGVWIDRLGHGLPAGSPIRPDRIVRHIAELRTCAAG